MLTRGLMGIDIGGTSIKAIVCDETGNILTFSSLSTLPAYRGSKMDAGPQRDFMAETIWDITKSVIKTVLRQLTNDCQVCSIAVSSVGCTMLAFGKDDHQIPICANSETLNEEFAKLSTMYGQTDFQSLTGYPRENSLTGLHLTGCARKVPGIARICSVDDFIVYKLTGIWSRNYSTAASNGMWDAIHDTWLEFIKQGTGLTDEILGKPSYGGVLVGNVKKKSADDTGLSTETKVSTGGMDYQCAAFCHHHLIGKNLFNITGTIDLMACYDEENSCNISKIRCIRDFHVMPGKRDIMVECVGAAHTEWLKNEIVARPEYGFSLNWDRFFDGLKANYKNQQFHNELFIPQVFGSSIPFSNKNATGVFGGLNKRTDSQMLLRTMLEGMAYQGKRMANHLSCEDKDKKIILVGGGSRNKTWVQIKADILGRDIIIPDTKESSAVGAALLGAVGAGIYRNYSEAGNAVKATSNSYVCCDKNRSEYYNEFFKEIYLPFVEQWNQISEKISLINERYRVKHENG